MRTKPFIRAVFASLALAIAIAGCDHADQLAPTSVDAPQIAVVPATNGQQYTLLEDRIPPDILDLEITKLLGILGGQITVAGHTLDVPALAVTQPTLFTVRLVPSGYLEVELEALLPSLFGLLDVGDDGFRKPLTLTLTYARSPNAPEDPSGITILYKRPDGSYEPIPTVVDPETKKATAKLWHFSGYILGDN